MQDNTYSEFSDPRLVAIYDTVNPIAEYRQFYIELAAKLAGERPLATIIDIGCGSGQLTCELAKQGHHLIGVEPSNSMLGLAKRRAANELAAAAEVNGLVSAEPNTAHVQWLHGGAQSLGAFDADLAIMTGHVAQFFLDDDIWAAALISIYKALKPGAYLAFESRNPVVQPFLKASRLAAAQVGGSTTEQASKHLDSEHSESEHLDSEHSESEHIDSEHIDWPSETSRRKVIDPVVGVVEWWFHLLSVDRDRVRYEIHYAFEKTGEEVVSVNELKFRARDELERSLVDAGFTVECVYGNWDFQLADAESPEFIFVARRP